MLWQNNLSDSALVGIIIFGNLWCEDVDIYTKPKSGHVGDGPVYLHFTETIYSAIQS